MIELDSNICSYDSKREDGPSRPDVGLAETVFPVGSFNDANSLEVPQWMAHNGAVLRWLCASYEIPVGISKRYVKV